MKTLRVLAVDDDAMNLEVVQAILGSEGHHVTLAHNGAEAVALWVERGERFDLILMDYNMPLMDGNTAIRQICAHGGHTQTALIVVTGSQAGWHEQEALDSGADRFFTKPFKRRQLLDAIATVLSAKGLLPVGESIAS